MSDNNKERDEKIAELIEWQTQKRINDGIYEGISKWWRTICITSVTSLGGILYTLGAWLYENSKGVYAAINAFISAMGTKP